MDCNQRRLVAELVRWQEVICCEDGSITNTSPRVSALPTAYNDVPDRSTRKTVRPGEYLFDDGALVSKYHIGLAKDNYRSIRKRD